jgi:hypothetical protein
MFAIIVSQTIFYMQYVGLCITYLQTACHVPSFSGSIVHHHQTES